MGALRLSGLKQGKDEVSWDELRSIPGRVENAGAIVDTAVGAAVPAAALIELAGPGDDVSFCSVVSSDASYTASIPLADLIEGGWLAFELDGEPLPPEKGGPIRLTVARGRTLCWNVKDVGELRFTATKEPDSLPEQPKH
jgi:DMSO/TMAO reductase YedYZ molybdopterin-dependent catalytic subunit